MKQLALLAMLAAAALGAQSGPHDRLAREIYS